MSQITSILDQIEAGDFHAAEELLPLVYDELRQLAMVRMRSESPGHTLQPTALVHDVYLRLVDVEKTQHFRSRRHFFGAAAEAMRRILIENARRKKRHKHGGDHQRVELDHVFQMTEERADQLIALEQALVKLAEESPQKAGLVKLRYFAGFSHQEAAEALGISRATADRYWAYAKVFLHCEMENADF